LAFVLLFWQDYSIMENFEHWVGQMELVEDSDQTKQLQGFLEDR